MDFKFKEFNKKRKFKEYVLGVDIGGTNINIGIAGVKNKRPILLYSLHYKTKNLPNISLAINHALDYSKEKFNIIITKACLAVAGVVKSDTYAELTNVSFNIDAKKILKRTKLKKIYLINDFCGIGYGINFISNKDIIQINRAKPQKNKVKAVIGAGTGLGKTILDYDKHIDAYIPLPSEGGHQDFPVDNDYQLDLIKFVKKSLKTNRPVNYQFILSGPGLVRIYEFVKYMFGTSEISKKIDKIKDKAPEISKYRKKDWVCKKTFHIFSMIYAKAAKNFCLETLCFGGLYIAGGIATKNIDIFDKKFLLEFQNHYYFPHILKKFPIYVIKNYDVSLWGSCYAAILNTQ